MALRSQEIEGSKAKAEWSAGKFGGENGVRSREAGQVTKMKNTSKIRVLCVDDHPVVRDGISAIINLQPDMTVAGAAATGAEGLERFLEITPDVTLVDLQLPDMTGFDLIKKIKQKSPNARIVVLSSHEGDVDIQRALEAGAQGYVAKGIVRGELLDAIRGVHAGKRWLPAALAQKLAEHMVDEPISPREVEVLSLVAAGKRNKEIASDLSIAEDTVKMHVRNILSKLQVNDRTEAVTIALRRGIIHL
jgi:DNA-binding NarL/FixJ family response regulator